MVIYIYIFNLLKDIPHRKHYTLNNEIFYHKTECLSLHLNNIIVRMHVREKNNYNETKVNYLNLSKYMTNLYLHIHVLCHGRN